MKFALIAVVLLAWPMVRAQAQVSCGNDQPCGIRNEFCEIGGCNHFPGGSTSQEYVSVKAMHMPCTCASYDVDDVVDETYVDSFDCILCSDQHSSCAVQQRHDMPRTQILYHQGRRGFWWRGILRQGLLVTLGFSHCACNAACFAVSC